MKPHRLLQIVALCVTLTLPIAPVVLTGCGTTSGRVIATSSTTVDHAMQAFAVWVVDGKATPEQELKARQLKSTYDSYEDIAVDAYTKFKATGDSSGWEEAKKLLWTHQSDLIQFIEITTGKKVSQ